ncbi:uncharacterized protein LOC125295790 [Alosa alosa]|uniref:uncharacterized protein LOC125295790 n=1 Tax=Alosa alosa TaxID=278164 RepID=UPI00201514D8|nr:uncharacterized protein LOC125295790 [Alosa alosa]
MESDLVEPKEGGRRRLAKGAIPMLFEWNAYRLTTRPSVWERRERPEEPELSLPLESDTEVSADHDYCAIPEPSSLDLSCAANEDLACEVEELKKQLQELRLQRNFGLQRFAGSDEDIRFYTRFPSYDHSMAFWWLTEPSVHKMVRITRARAAAKKNEEVTRSCVSGRQVLQPIDEFFLFLVHLSVGLKERDLGHRFGIHSSTVSRVVSSWTNYLYTLLGVSE